MTDWREWLRENFLARWVLANVIGWTAGLYLVAALGSLPGLVCAAGGVTGAVVGLAQWAVLRQRVPLEPRWIALTLLAGLAGVGVVTLASLLFLNAWALVGLVGGAVFGLFIGLAQWNVFPPGLGRLHWWIPVNALAGAICGLLTMLPIIPGLPLGLLAGSAVFGAITGRALVWLTGAPADEPHNSV